MSFDTFKKFNSETFSHEEYLYAKYDFISSFGDDMSVGVDDVNIHSDEDLCNDTSNMDDLIQEMYKVSTDIARNGNQWVGLPSFCWH